MSNFRLQRLRERHLHLSLLLIRERLKARPDEFLIQSLKRQKLQLQDQLEIASLGLVPVTARFGQR